MNETTLDKWSSHYHSTDEMRQVFCAQSDALKRTHSYGYYVTDFNLDQILVGETEHHQKYVVFKSVKKLPLHEEEFYMKKNVRVECFQEVGLYCSMLSDVTISFTPQFLKENFDRFAPFLPEEDFPFYKKVFVFDTMMYLCDYVERNNQMKISKMESDGGSGKSYTKSTPQGKAFLEEQAPFKPMDGSSQSAFAQTFVLPFVIFALSLLIPLLTFIFSSL